MTSTPITLLLVDDNPAHSRLSEIEISKSHHDVSLVMLTEPPKDLTDCLKYDGIILDQELGRGVLGFDIARRIHRLNWRLPMMLYTNHDPRSIPDALAYVDVVCSKHDHDQFTQAMRAFIRNIARIKLR